MSCNYYCVFQLVKDEAGPYELCTHCQTRTPIALNFADAHTQQCENWLENQGRMWPAVRPKIELLDRPGAFITLFGKPTEEELEYKKQREQESQKQESE